MADQINNVPLLDINRDNLPLRDEFVDALAAVVTRERVDHEQAQERVGLVQRSLGARELAAPAPDAGVFDDLVTHDGPLE